MLSSFAKWLTESGKATGTCKTYVSVIHQFSEWIGDINSIDITSEHVQSYIKYLENQGKSPSTVEKHFMAINVFFRYLGKPQIMYNINRRAKEKNIEIPDHLNENEEKLLLEQVKSEGNFRNITIVYLLLHTGIRVSELCQLNRRDIEIKGTSGVIHVKNSQGEFDRLVPLSSECIGHISRYMDTLETSSEDALFISSYNQRITTRAVQYLLKKYDIHPHMLRHTFCVKLIKSGIDVATVAKLAGHKDVNVTKRYILQDSNEKLQQAINQTFA